MCTGEDGWDQWCTLICLLCSACPQICFRQPLNNATQPVLQSNISVTTYCLPAALAMRPMYVHNTFQLTKATIQNAYSLLCMLCMLCCCCSTRALCVYRSQWLRQSSQLVRLCSAVLQRPSVENQQTAPSASSMGSCTTHLRASSVRVSPSKSESTQAHQLLQTASARLLMVLTDDKLWKCFQPGTLKHH